MVEGGQRRAAAGEQMGILGQHDGQIGLGNRNRPARITIDHGDGGAPVALARNPPIPQPVTDRPPAQPLGLEQVGDLFHRLAIGLPVERSGIDHQTVAGIRFRHLGGDQGLAFRVDHRDFLAKSKSR